MNDLLPSYEELLNRFEASDIPLAGTFGSSSISTSLPVGLLIAIGPAVEPARLAEVLQLVEGTGQVFLIVHDEPSHNKEIIIGAMNLETEPIVAVTDELLGAIRRPGATAEELVKAIGLAPKVQPIRRRESKQ